MIKNKKGVCELGSFYIVYTGSTQFETPGYRGISHLVEHCMYEPLMSMQNIFTKYAIFANAHVSNHELCIYMTGIDKCLDKFKNKFLDKILNYTIPENVFIRERDIVIQEYKEMMTTQYNIFITNHLRSCYNYAGPIGVLEDIENITYENFIKFKNKYFNKPTNIFSVGNKDFIRDDISFNNHKWDLKLIRGNYNNIPLIDKINFKNNDVVFFDNLFTDFSPKDLFYIKLFNAYLSNGLGSPLMKDLREKHRFVYGVQAYQDVYNKDVISYISTETQTENVDKLIDRTYSIIDKCSKHISKSRYDAIASEMKYGYIKYELTNIDPDIHDYGVEQRNIIFNNKFSYNEFCEFVKERFPKLQVSIASRQ